MTIAAISLGFEDVKQLALVLILIVLILLLMRVGKRKGDNSRASRMMKKYAVISRKELDAIDDDELVEAVVCRVLAKAEEERIPDVVHTLSTMEHGSTVVYSVWSVCREMAKSDFATLMKTATRSMVEPAVNGFEVIGAPRCAAALAALQMQADEEGEQALRQAMQTECPLSLLVPFIRDHAEQFVDDAPVGKTVEILSEDSTGDGVFAPEEKE